MDAESQHIKYLIIVTAMLCAVIIGYNAFYVPDANMSKISISTDASSVSASESSETEGYTPESNLSGNSGYVFSSAKSKSSISSIYGTASSASENKKTESSKSSKVIHGKININTASANELSSGLSGVGDVLAKRIVDYREKNGKFKTIDDIKKVSGIGDKKYESIKDFITV